MRKAAFALLIASLAACSAERAPPDAVADAPPPAAPDQPAEDIPPATAPGLSDDGAAPVPGGTGGDGAQAPAADADLATFEGYGDLKFGMPADGMDQAWGGELARVGPEGEACYFKTPKWVKAPADFAFMVENGKFVRYGAESERIAAPGGGTVGMARADIDRLYAGRIEEQPHKYVEGGKYLRIADAATANALLFEVDAAGKVTEWRVGQAPQVDYVEGCG